jgi:hypothetical protein
MYSGNSSFSNGNSFSGSESAFIEAPIWRMLDPAAAFQYLHGGG